jgi:hypothetical protein
MTRRQRWFSLALVAVLATGAASRAVGQTNSDVVIQISGDVPGFASQDQLARFLADKMTGA